MNSTAEILSQPLDIGNPLHVVGVLGLVLFGFIQMVGCIVSMSDSQSRTNIRRERAALLQERRVLARDRANFERERAEVLLVPQWLPFPFVIPPPPRERGARA